MSAVLMVFAVSCQDNLDREEPTVECHFNEDCASGLMCDQLTKTCVVPATLSDMMTSPLDVSDTDGDALDGELDLVENDDLMPDEDIADDDVDIPSIRVCERAGWEVRWSEDATYDEGLDILYYYIFSAPSEPFDWLLIDWTFAGGAAGQPAVYAFNTLPYTQCHTCSMIGVNCSVNVSCEAFFLATSGQLTIEEIGVAGDALSGRIDDTVFSEVWFDANTFETTLVPNGQTWCLDDFEFAVPAIGIP